MEGTIKWWNLVKGFGFIQCSDGSGRDYFLHIRNYSGAIPAVGTRVQFELAPNPRDGRIEAVKARPLGDANAVGVSALIHSVNEVTKLSDGTEVHRVVL